ncbi:Heparan sulfate 2-O-sulfotransferase pipe [Nymphon striatum]|nr:Heparan sulfate 2-O-sulfotransferase pipe [Nymphon striatum]
MEFFTDSNCFCLVMRYEDSKAKCIESSVQQLQNVCASSNPRMRFFVRIGIMLMFLTVWALLYSKHLALLLRQEKEILSLSINLDQLNVTSKRMEDILVYNKVPKCGSSTLGQLLIELSKINNFTLGGEYHGPQSFNRKIQENVIERIEALPRPVYFQGHYSFINHTKFGRMEPVYINLLRDPVDRLVSYYFFDRMKGSKLRFYKKYPVNERPERISHDFMKCFEKREGPCSYIKDTLEPLVGKITINFFCGHEEFCRAHGNTEALEKAKYVIESSYSVVGILEEFEKTLAVFEHYLPKYFRGVSEIYTQNNLYKNKIKKPYNFEHIKAELRKNMTTEYELLQFVKQRLHLQFLSISDNL